MTKERFLTVRWNNILTLAGGLVLLAYLVFVIFTPVLSDNVAFIGLVVFGVLY